MISLTNVSKIYHMGGEDVYALRQASLSVRDGEFVSIIGPSGSGKSTMMNIIGCLDTADEGDYMLDGEHIRNYSQKELAKVRNRKIGFIFQNFNLLSKMTAFDNVELPLVYQKLPAAERSDRVKWALNQVKLYDRKDHRPAELSGGQQQRVAIARALASKPSLFLADEPTGALDSKTSAEIMGIFQNLHEQGNTIIIITHDETVADQAERKIRIRDGQVSEVAV
ncbi:MAG: ABC transporter ATP-binding protein [Clostridium sp.]|nr:ABC transporter ATP-binding protein [Clostridium sp.]